GVDPVKVERILTTIFKIASRWKAILLLDEAEYFWPSARMILISTLSSLYFCVNWNSTKGP
ncbi:hypothetical protein EDB80DRAFT_590863, partial [Ilyonectria destructans]